MNAEQEIRRRIKNGGAITFSEFMDVALFWPVGGYYSGDQRIGPYGDFYTAPTAHPAFGALLSIQIFQMWQILGRPSPFFIVELGSGNNTLCRDILNFSQNMPEGYSNCLDYICVDRQQPNITDVIARNELGQQYITSKNIPLRNIVGCFLSNELVDSFPVHRFVINNGAIKELYITIREEDFVEISGAPSDPGIAESLKFDGPPLPNGFKSEVNLEIATWQEELSSALDQGFVITIDYGSLKKNLYSHERRNGTMGCYYRHMRTDNPYRHIGEQDITAHVDFESIMQAGNLNGLDTIGFTTQREFLNGLGLQTLVKRLQALGLNQNITDANRMGMVDISRSLGMGDFKVLIQGKNVDDKTLWGLTPTVKLEKLWESLPVPLLSDYHMPLFSGTYPQHTFEWNDLLEQ